MTHWCLITTGALKEVSRFFASKRRILSKSREHETWLLPSLKKAQGRKSVSGSLNSSDIVQPAMIRMWGGA